MNPVLAFITAHWFAVLLLVVALVPGVFALRSQLRGSLSFQTFPDFLLGESAPQNGRPYSNIFTSTAAQGTYYKGYRAREMASFLQDDFKANSRLTLNLGVRWEINTGVSEAFGNMSGLSTALILSSPPPTAAGSFAGFVVPGNYSQFLPAGVTRLEVISDPYRQLTAEQAARFDGYVERRSRREIPRSVIEQLARKRARLAIRIRFARRDTGRRLHDAVEAAASGPRTAVPPRI